MAEILALKGRILTCFTPIWSFLNFFFQFSPQKTTFYRRSKMGEKLVVSDFDEIAATPPKSTLLITKMGLKLL